MGFHQMLLPTGESIREQGRRSSSILPNGITPVASRRVTTDVAANSPGHALRRAQAPMLGRPRFPDAAPILKRRPSPPVSDLMPRVTAYDRSEGEPNYQTLARVPHATQSAWEE